jgi:nitrogen fixation protein NifB
MSDMMNLSHPCFNADAKGRFGRVHLPVAVSCNIKCNYCTRKYDCVNESRPGVTSNVLTPRQALAYVEKVLEKEPRIKVAGIAGPGDPFANPVETMETLRLIRKKFPDLLLCLSTNGLGIGPHIDELIAIGVSHVTITVNAVDPEIGQKIYSWVRDGKVIHRGRSAAEILLKHQLEAITALKAGGITVKVNMIVVPSVNEEHVEEVARRMAELKVDLLNCMAMYPNRDTPFENIKEPDALLMETIRAKAEQYLPQMRHCTRCRADAVGLLGQDDAGLLGCLSDCANGTAGKQAKPHVAVATREGLLVNLHMGEAERFQIWTRTKEGFECIEERVAPEPGGGIKRWVRLAEMLQDCRAVLVSGIGDNPRMILSDKSIEPIAMTGFIRMGLEAVYSGQNLSKFRVRQAGGCAKGAGCSGDGEGC